MEQNGHTDDLTTKPLNIISRKEYKIRVKNVSRNENNIILCKKINLESQHTQEL